MIYQYIWSVCTSPPPTHNRTHKSRNEKFNEKRHNFRPMTISDCLRWTIYSTIQKCCIMSHILGSACLDNKCAFVASNGQRWYLTYFIKPGEISKLNDPLMLLFGLTIALCRCRGNKHCLQKIVLKFKSYNYLWYFERKS